ncbi:nef [Simian immunodeficiency virus]|uniref:Protein Nef n=1 Tax=Simian immunodeficiency virus TaxID=11723 RepID=A0A075TCC6_SIV|nr:nef [Simian immunodeficiency virus]
MGSKNSKQQSSQPGMPSPYSPGTGQKLYWRIFGDLPRGLLPSRGESGREPRYYSIREETAETAKRGEVVPVRYNEGDSTRDDDEEGVGFPVCPQVPLRQMTFKTAVDFSWFLKEKGGLEGLFYSPERHKKLDLYAYNVWGLVPGWQGYTQGPGTRFPTCFGILWELVPVEIGPQGLGEGDERASLLHAGQQVYQDPHCETLVWHFNPTLAFEPGILKADKLGQKPLPGQKTFLTGRD